MVKMVHLVALWNTLSISLAFSPYITPKKASMSNYYQRKKNNDSIFTHTKATSPYLDLPKRRNDLKHNGKRSHNSDDSSKSTSIEELCIYLGATPQSLLYLDSDNESDDSDGERGVFLNYSVEKDDILLKIPLSSCIRDDKPPPLV